MVKGKQTPWCPESLCIHRVSGPWCPESLCIHISEHVKRLNTRTFQTQLDTQTPKPATLELFQTQLDNAKQAGGLRTTGAGTGTASRTPSSSSTTAGRRSCVPGSSRTSRTTGTMARIAGTRGRRRRTSPSAARSPTTSSGCGRRVPAQMTHGSNGVKASRGPALRGHRQPAPGKGQAERGGTAQGGSGFEASRRRGVRDLLRRLSACLSWLRRLPGPDPLRRRPACLSWLHLCALREHLRGVPAHLFMNLQCEVDGIAPQGATPRHLGICKPSN